MEDEMNVPQYDPHALCEVSENQEPEVELGTRFEVDPSVMFPATIVRIQDVLLTGVVPIELMDRKPVFGVNPLAAAEQLILRAKNVPQFSWEHALAHKRDCPALAMADRAEALEVARLWFTQAMQVKEGQVILHILRDLNDTYRL